MNTIDFKPKTIIENRHFPKKEGTWPVAIDIGYSSVKGISPGGYFCFPAYAKEVPETRERMKAPSPEDILYKDKYGVWAVGNLAYTEMLTTGELDSEEELYGRNRYYSRMFMALAMTALALGARGNVEGGPESGKIAIQTGLPPRYRTADTPMIRDVFSGRHEFSLKIGNGMWRDYAFNVDLNDVYVMPQPLGALISASIDKTGLMTPEAEDLLSSSLVVFDPGFGTLDDYTVISGSVKGTGETFPSLGMREVLQRTCDDILTHYGKAVSVQFLINNLDQGMIYIMDRQNMKRAKYDFAQFLEKNCREVCMEAIEQMKSVHDYFADVDYIIAAGGLYEAWAPWFNEAFEQMEGLKIIAANCNDTSLSNVFSNVRGYYFYLANGI